TRAVSGASSAGPRRCCDQDNRAGACVLVRLAGDVAGNAAFFLRYDNGIGCRSQATVPGPGLIDLVCDCWRKGGVGVETGKRKSSPANFQNLWQVARLKKPGAGYRRGVVRLECQ